MDTISSTSTTNNSHKYGLAYHPNHQTNVHQDIKNNTKNSASNIKDKVSHSDYLMHYSKPSSSQRQANSEQHVPPPNNNNEFLQNYQHMQKSDIFQQNCEAIQTSLHPSQDYSLEYERFEPVYKPDVHNYKFCTEENPSHSSRHMPSIEYQPSTQMPDLKENQLQSKDVSREYHLSREKLMPPQQLYQLPSLIYQPKFEQKTLSQPDQQHEFFAHQYHFDSQQRRLPTSQSSQIKCNRSKKVIKQPTKQDEQSYLTSVRQIFNPTGQPQSTPNFRSSSGKRKKKNSKIYSTGPSNKYFPKIFTAQDTDCRANRLLPIPIKEESSHETVEEKPEEKPPTPPKVEEKQEEETIKSDSKASSGTDQVTSISEMSESDMPLYSRCFLFRCVELVACTICTIVALTTYFITEEQTFIQYMFLGVATGWFCICLYDVIGYTMHAQIPCYYTWILFCTMAYLCFITSAGWATVPQGMLWKHIVVLICSILVAIVFLADLGSIMLSLCQIKHENKREKIEDYADYLRVKERATKLKEDIKAKVKKKPPKEENKPIVKESIKLEDSKDQPTKVKGSQQHTITQFAKINELVAPFSLIPPLWNSKILYDEYELACHQYDHSDILPHDNKHFSRAYTKDQELSQKTLFNTSSYKFLAPNVKYPWYTKKSPQSTDSCCIDIIDDDALSSIANLNDCVENTSCKYIDSSVSGENTNRSNIEISHLQNPTQKKIIETVCKNEKSKESLNDETSCYRSHQSFKENTDEHLNFPVDNNYIGNTNSFMKNESSIQNHNQYLNNYKTSSEPSAVVSAPISVEANQGFSMQDLSKLSFPTELNELIQRNEEFTRISNEYYKDIPHSTDETSIKSHNYFTEISGPKSVINTLSKNEKPKEFLNDKTSSYGSQPNLRNSDDNVNEAVDYKATNNMESFLQKKPSNDIYKQHLENTNSNNYKSSCEQVSMSVPDSTEGTIQGNTYYPIQNIKDLCFPIELNELVQRNVDFIRMYNTSSKKAVPHSTEDDKASAEQINKTVLLDTCKEPQKGSSAKESEHTDKPKDNITRCITISAKKDSTGNITYVKKTCNTLPNLKTTAKPNQFDLDLRKTLSLKRNDSNLSYSRQELRNPDFNLAQMDYKSSNSQLNENNNSYSPMNAQYGKENNFKPENMNTVNKDIIITQPSTGYFIRDFSQGTINTEQHKRIIPQNIFASGSIEQNDSMSSQKKKKSNVQSNSKSTLRKKNKYSIKKIYSSIKNIKVHTLDYFLARATEKKNKNKDNKKDVYTKRCKIAKDNSLKNKSLNNESNLNDSQFQMNSSMSSQMGVDNLNKTAVEQDISLHESMDSYYVHLENTSTGSLNSNIADRRVYDALYDSHSHLGRNNTQCNTNIFRQNRFQNLDNSPVSRLPNYPVYERTRNHISVNNNSKYFTEEHFRTQQQQDVNRNLNTEAMYREYNQPKLYYDSFPSEQTTTNFPLNNISLESSQLVTNTSNQITDPNNLTLPHLLHTPDKQKCNNPEFQRYYTNDYPDTSFSLNRSDKFSQEVNVQPENLTNKTEYTYSPINMSRSEQYRSHPTADITREQYVSDINQPQSNIMTHQISANKLCHAGTRNPETRHFEQMIPSEIFIGQNFQSNFPAVSVPRQEFISYQMRPQDNPKEESSSYVSHKFQATSLESGGGYVQPENSSDEHNLTKHNDQHFVVDIGNNYSEYFSNNCPELSPQQKDFQNKQSEMTPRVFNLNSNNEEANVLQALNQSSVKLGRLNNNILGTQYKPTNDINETENSNKGKTPICADPGSTFYTPFLPTSPNKIPLRSNTLLQKDLSPKDSQPRVASFNLTEPHSSKTGTIIASNKLNVDELSPIMHTYANAQSSNTHFEMNNFRNPTLSEENRKEEFQNIENVSNDSMNSQKTYLISSQIEQNNFNHEVGQINMQYKEKCDPSEKELDNPDTLSKKSKHDSQTEEFIKTCSLHDRSVSELGSLSSNTNSTNISREKFFSTDSSVKTQYSKEKCLSVNNEEIKTENEIKKDVNALGDTSKEIHKQKILNNDKLRVVNQEESCNCSDNKTSKNIYNSKEDKKQSVDSIAPTQDYNFSKDSLRSEYSECLSHIEYFVSSPEIVKEIEETTVLDTKQKSEMTEKDLTAEKSENLGKIPENLEIKDLPKSSTNVTDNKILFDNENCNCPCGVVNSLSNK